MKTDAQIQTDVSNLLLGPNGLAEQIANYVIQVRDGKDANLTPKTSTAGKQIPGCLPEGYTLDSMLTPEQFCIWQQVGKRWFSLRKRSLPGVAARSREMVRVHPRTYIEKVVKGAK